MKLEIMPSEQYEVLFMKYEKKKPCKKQIENYLEKEIPWFDQSCIIDIQSYMFTDVSFLIISVTKNNTYIAEHRKKNNQILTAFAILSLSKKINQNSFYKYGNEYIRLGAKPTRQMCAASNDTMEYRFIDINSDYLIQCVKKNNIKKRQFYSNRTTQSIFGICFFLLILSSVFLLPIWSKKPNEYSFSSAEEFLIEEKLVESESIQFQQALVDTIEKIHITTSKIKSLQWQKSHINPSITLFEIVLENGDPIFFDDHENTFIRFEKNIPIFKIQKDYHSVKSSPIEESIYNFTHKISRFAILHDIELKAIHAGENFMYEFSYSGTPFSFFSALSIFCQKENVEISYIFFEVSPQENKYTSKLSFSKKLHELSNYYLSNSNAGLVNKSFVSFIKIVAPENFTTPTVDLNEKIGSIMTEGSNKILFLKEADGKITTKKETLQ